MKNHVIECASPQTLREAHVVHQITRINDWEFIAAEQEENNKITRHQSSSMKIEAEITFDLVYDGTTLNSIAAVEVDRAMLSSAFLLSGEHEEHDGVVIGDGMAHAPPLNQTILALGRGSRSFILGPLLLIKATNTLHRSDIRKFIREYLLAIKENPRIIDDLFLGPETRRFRCAWPFLWTFTEE